MGTIFIPDASCRPPLPERPRPRGHDTSNEDMILWKRVPITSPYGALAAPSQAQWQRPVVTIDCVGYLN